MRCFAHHAELLCCTLPQANFVSQTRCRVAGLLEEEVIGIRLYTGPMYIHYNRYGSVGDGYS